MHCKVESGCVVVTFFFSLYLWTRLCKEATTTCGGKLLPHKAFAPCPVTIPFPFLLPQH